MAAFRTTGRLIQAYAESEPWKESHDRAMFCRSLEEVLGWGVRIFRGLTDLAVIEQARALEADGTTPTVVWSEYERIYRAWVEASESYLMHAMKLSEEGYAIEGLDEFRRVFEEAHCQTELWDFEPELAPIEDARFIASPGNPRPARYGA